MTDDNTVREMSERAHILSELTTHPGWAVFQQCAGEELARQQRAVLGGTLDEKAYIRTTGYLAGAEMIASIPAHMMRLYLDTVARQREEEQYELDERSDADAPHPLPV